MLAPLLLSVLVAQSADAPPWVDKLDRLGDPLPAGAVARFGSVRYRHGTELTDLQLSPGGKCVVTRAKDDSQIRLWETASGRELGCFPEKGANVQRVLFLSNATVAVVADGVWLWTAGRPVVRVPPDLLPEKADAIALSPDGKTLAVGGEKAVHLMPLDAPKEVTKALAANAPPLGLAFSPDGKWLAAENAASLSLWEVGKGKRVRSFAVPDKPLARFNAASDRLYCQTLTGVRLLTLDSDENDPAFAPFASQGKLCDLRLSGDGKTLFALESSGTLHHLDAKTGKPVGKPMSAPTGVADWLFAALAPDGKTVVSRWPDQRWATWHPATGAHSAIETAAPFVALRLSPDGKTAISQDEKDCFRAWAVADGKPIRDDWPRGRNSSGGTAWDESGDRVLHETGDKAVVCLRVKDGEFVKKLPAEETAAVSVGFLAGHPTRCIRFLAESVQLCDLDGQQPTRMFAYAALAGGGCAALSPDGRTLVVGGKKEETLLIETATGKVRLSVKVQASEVKFAPDGRTLGIGEMGGFVTLLDSVTGRRLWQVSLIGSGHTVFAFSPDGKQFAATCRGSERSIQLWNTATADLITDFPGSPSGDTTGIAYTPDGRQLVTCGADGCGYMWDVRYRKPPEPLGRVFAFDSVAEARAALISADGEEAYQAVARLAARPAEALLELRMAVRPATGPVADEIAKWRAKLSSKEFKERDAGRKALAEAGAAATLALQAEAKTPGTLESGRIATELLARLQRGYGTPAELLAARAVEVAERIGTPEAKKLLAAWADGAPLASLTVEAKAALGRMK